MTALTIDALGVRISVIDRDRAREILFDAARSCRRGYVRSGARHAPQTRSFMWIDDCVKGTQMIMEGNFVEPLNLGSSELVSSNQLVDIVEEIGGVKLKRSYNLKAPKGVNGRNSDNTLIQKIYNWELAPKLRDGLERTYHWIYDQMTKGKVLRVEAGVRS